MKRIFVASLIALSSSQVFAMDSLKEFAWKNRVVLVFGSAADQTLLQQIEILNRQKAELEERDMVVIRVSEGEARAVYGNAPALKSVDLRTDADIKSEAFQVVLVGMDGGIKLRSEKVVSDVEMFDLIDGMPMRRAKQN
ncbi:MULTISPECIES: DUF4174 domain-containing protein [unclassified Rhizobium]|uniref:DUF4174 domain-containing protein n=1 Tax=unclassified Rhizobium TaxID=2613769 RepID=UPI0017855B4B|nr:MULTISPECIES: DUF4174 domain-containing protein [unclassified Rhizobium]MBD8687356.1 DUF4174 domain-containing protein [Rhizobium sp. CFBP 13644]MBD8691810.1 DUF4174 domain-containing protein [Rhizobium sp. CFBP 13717]